MDLYKTELKELNCDNTRMQCDVRSMLFFFSQNNTLVAKINGSIVLLLDVYDDNIISVSNDTQEDEKSIYKEMI